VVAIGASGTLAEIEPDLITQNPNNPRRFFNEERLDLLRTSIQETGILVPLIVYQQRNGHEQYVLMDGERRWRCAIDLALPSVPANVIDAPTPLENLLKMFNIHNVREDWPLISIALSLREVMALSEESGEKRLHEMTGLTRATVRRAKRMLSIPDEELELIRAEAHLDRTQQVHREDLYLEIEQAESVLRNQVPEIAHEYTREQVIRKFAEKAESGTLDAVTDFRFVGKLLKAAEEHVLDRGVVVEAARSLVQDPGLSPKVVFDDVAAVAYRQYTVQRKLELLGEDLASLSRANKLSKGLVDRLKELRELIDRILGENR
jgi:ParB family chromosome partitioning protein